MPTEQEKYDRQKRTAEKLADPNFLEEICDYVCSGTSVITLCERWDIRYHEVVKWVYDKTFPSRKVRYEESITAQMEWAKQRILDELQFLGLSDIREAYDDNGHLKEMKDMPVSIARALAGVETVVEASAGTLEKNGDVTYTKKIKLWDKLRALELLGKNLALFVDKSEVNHKGKVSLEQMVAGSNESPAAEAEAKPSPVAIPEKTNEAQVGPHPDEGL